jgi:hypothetical protein
MKLKTILSLALSIFVITQSIANNVEKNRCSNYEKGTITLKNGKQKSTYIFIDHCNPNRHQQKLSTISEKTFKKYSEGKKIKKSTIEVYKTKDISGFILDNGKEYRQVKYSNMLSTKKMDMIPKRYLLEVVADGDITVYKKHYRTENGFIYNPVSNSKLKGGPEHYEFMVTNFELLFQKDKSKNAKNIRNANLKNIIGDNEDILKKFQEGGYAFRDEIQRPATFAVNCDNQFLDALLEIINDYNGVATDRISSTTFKK